MLRVSGKRTAACRVGNGAILIACSLKTRPEREPCGPGLRPRAVLSVFSTTA